MEVAKVFQAVLDIDDFVTELTFVMVIFCLLYLANRVSSKERLSLAAKSANEEQCELCKQLETDLSFGGPAKVLSTWRAAYPRRMTSPRALRIVMQACVASESESSVSEICEHMKQHRRLCTSDIVANLLDIMARAGKTKAMEELLHCIRQHHPIPENDRINDIFLGGFAFAGQEEKVCELIARNQDFGKSISARGYCLTIKGFLQNSMTNAALQQMRAMSREGLPVPSSAVTKICRVASEVDNCLPVIDDLEKYSWPVSSVSVGILMKDCQKRQDLKTAFRVEKISQINRTPLTIFAYDSLLMLCVSHGDVYAFKVFEDMQQVVGNPSSGLCLGLIAQCPESKFSGFAEMMADYLRKNNEMSIQAYSALMKVYATCGMYDKACDLYAQMEKEGLKPDSLMYGCLMKFAVECGRTELSHELSRAIPQLDIQNYISLIRAAGRDRDIDRAFRVVNEMKSHGVNVDIAAYSCVLDVCVLAGDMKRARTLLSEMQKVGSLDVVVYNTLLKGYCNSGDTVAAMALLLEMDAASLKPNDVSFNCLINAAAATGNFKEAWSLVEMMESRGLKIDNFTMSILMKVLKKARTPHSSDIAKTFELLDRSGVDISGDEVVLNVVLETCMRHRELGRLNTIFMSYLQSGRRPSLHTTAILIKASGMLKRIDICRELWGDLTENRRITPNDYLLCDMLDALVSNDCLEEAMSLLNEWENEVGPSAYAYASILKGLANTNQNERAMELYLEIRARGVSLNTYVFTTLINMQARVGNTDKVSELVQTMKSMGCKPDDVTSATIIKANVVNGDIEEAFRAFRDMQKDGIAFDSVYSAILDGCIKCNRMDLADSVIKALEKSNVKPSNSTLCMLVTMYGRRRQLQKAFDILSQLSDKHDLYPSTRVKSCLMSACLNNNEVEKAYEVFQDIKSCGQEVHAKTYNALIIANTKHNNLGEAVRLVEEAYGFGQQRGLAPMHTLESDVIVQLLRALRRNGRTDGLILFEKLRASGMHINSQLFNTVMNY